MISNLSISNYALIKHLKIAPDAHLNIITGETGAGKSILLGAIGLLIGNRADTKALLDQNKKCVIEGEFDLSPLSMEALFKEEELDYDPHTILRREISPKGKSRAFINDLPVTLDLMRKVGLQLVDIHSQNESMQLSEQKVKIKILDDYANTSKELINYQQIFITFNKMRNKRTALENQVHILQADAEYKIFLLEELNSAKLKKGEQEKLEEELKMLSNAEEIKLKLSQLSNSFDQNDFSLIDQLKKSAVTMRHVSGFSYELAQLSDRLGSAIEEIQDVVTDVAGVAEGMVHDPERIEKTSQRLDVIYKLQQKHQTNTIESLLTISEKLATETENSLYLTEEINRLKLATEEVEKKLIKSAEKLSEKRRKHIDWFSQALNLLLVEVGIPNGQVALVYKRIAPQKWGIDEVEMLFSANKGIAPEPVANVASGGEFSRLMFCIKYLLAQKTAMPTVIFDEIDTGVSGEIAIKMGNMMQRMAQKHQIIAISHLPQITARGSAHYLVYKNNESDTTESMIRQLNHEERIQEIAQMIGGEKPSELARSSARELIERR